MAPCKGGARRTTRDRGTDVAGRGAAAEARPMTLCSTHGTLVDSDRLVRAAPGSDGVRRWQEPACARVDAAGRASGDRSSRSRAQPRAHTGTDTGARAPSRRGLWRTDVHASPAVPHLLRHRRSLRAGVQVVRDPVQGRQGRLPGRDGVCDHRGRSGVGVSSTFMSARRELGRTSAGRSASRRSHGRNPHPPGLGAARVGLTVPGSHG